MKASSIKNNNQPVAFEHGVNPSTVSSSRSGAGAVGGWPKSSMDDWLAGPPLRTPDSAENAAS